MIFGLICLAVLVVGITIHAIAYNYCRFETIKFDTIAIIEATLFLLFCLPICFRSYEEHIAYNATESEKLDKFNNAMYEASTLPASLISIPTNTFGRIGQALSKYAWGPANVIATICISAILIVILKSITLIIYEFTLTRREEISERMKGKEHGN